MRYQGVNQEILHQSPNSNPKKHVLKLCSRDNNSLQNGEKAPASMSASRVKGSSTVSMKNPDPENSENVMGNKNPEEIPSAKAPKEEGNEILQWCRKKRPRGNRNENKAEYQGSNGGKVVKPEGQASKSEKRKHEATVHSRATTLRPCTPLRESYQASAKRRSEDLKGQNGVSNVQLPKTEKHSLTSHGKTLKGVPLFSACANTRAADSTTVPEKKSTEAIEWPRILISLSRKEKEEDFLLMKGTKLPQRPKKRLKCVERALQNCFPGSWLPDLSKGRYAVKEKKCMKKKPLGLKAMKSSDSDTD